MEGEKDELYIFLRHRGFEEDKIESLKNEKVRQLKHTYQTLYNQA